MLPIQKAVGPDGISNKLLKEFAPELAPLIQDIYNQSLREGFVPDTLKGLGHAILGNFREFQHGSNSHRIN